MKDKHSMEEKQSIEDEHSMEEMHSIKEKHSAENNVPMVTGRLSNNTIVHLPGDASMIGKIVPVSLDECHGFYYIGHCVSAENQP